MNLETNKHIQCEKDLRCH